MVSVEDAPVATTMAYRALLLREATYTLVAVASMATPRRSLKPVASVDTAAVAVTMTRTLPLTQSATNSLAPAVSTASW